MSIWMGRLWNYIGRTNDTVGEPLAYRAWKWLLQRTTAHRFEPTLFDRIETTEWDLLIILDACRYDTLEDVSEHGVIEKEISPASATPEFLSSAYETGVFDETTYVSANPQTANQIPGESIEYVPLYNEQWDDSVSTVPPRTVYERARAGIRSGQQVVAHTVQPHYPHICEINGDIRPIPGGVHPRIQGFDTDAGIQELLSTGEVDLSVFKRSYEQSVRFAWKKARDIANDLSNEGYNVVITADHGELFGEMGLVEHPVGVRLEPLVAVPWVEFTQMNTSREKSNPNGETNVEDRLAALGYK